MTLLTINLYPRSGAQTQQIIVASEGLMVLFSHPNWLNFINEATKNARANKETDLKGLGSDEIEAAVLSCRIDPNLIHLFNTQTLCDELNNMMLKIGIGSTGATLANMRWSVNTNLMGISDATYTQPLPNAFSISVSNLLLMYGIPVAVLSQQGGKSALYIATRDSGKFGDVTSTICESIETGRISADVFEKIAFDIMAGAHRIFTNRPDIAAAITALQPLLNQPPFEKTVCSVQISEEVTPFLRLDLRENIETTGMIADGLRATLDPKLTWGLTEGGTQISLTPAAIQKINGNPNIVRWSRFMRQVFPKLRWKPAARLNGLCPDRARGDG